MTFTASSSDVVGLASRIVSSSYLCDVLEWLSVWSKVWYALFAHGLPKTALNLVSFKIQNGFIFVVLAYPGYPGKEVVKWCFDDCVPCMSQWYECNIFCFLS